jgi:glycosyltransferase involved in cell wall biosynthesis
VNITFVIPFVHLTGGIRMVLEHANALHDRGHCVRVVYPEWPYRFHFTRRQQFAEFRQQLRSPVRVSWCALKAPLVRLPCIRSALLPRADVVVATSWPTAVDVARLTPSCGRKVHLVMHHEGDTGPEQRVRELYRLPMFRITISRHIREELEQRFQCRVDDVVPCGVNEHVFFRDGQPASPTVVMLYHPEPRKGAAEGIAALSRLRGRCPGVNARLCGLIKPDRLPDAISFTWQPNDAELRRLYSTSTALLYPSRYEGFGLPPLEAMACGCPVVTTRVGAIPEFAVDRQNALVVEAGDVQGMADRLEELLQSPELCARLATHGIRTAHKYRTLEAGRRLEAALLRALQ